MGRCVGKDGKKKDAKGGKKKDPKDDLRSAQVPLKQEPPVNIEGKLAYFDELIDRQKNAPPCLSLELFNFIPIIGEEMVIILAYNLLRYSISNGRLFFILRLVQIRQKEGTLSGRLSRHFCTFRR